MDKNLLNLDLLSEELKADIKKYAGQHGISENQFIEKAVLFFLQEVKRKAFIAGIKEYRHDEGIIEIAEWGMEDYAEQLKKHPV